MGMVFRSVTALVLLLGLVAMAFAAYVAIDNDSRTLVWDKWRQEVPFEWPGGGRNIRVDIEVE
ncbi:MAG: hypothetical protein RMK67_08045 [Chloroflexota bacterium]|nr:hypothetical protein [Chloroflexota bacterium]